MIRQSSLSAERLRSRVESLTDPTGTACRWAFVTSGEPVGGDWNVGTWETAGWDGTWATAVSPTVSGTDGGGTVPLADGCYDIWLEVTGAGGELPKRRLPSQIEIY